MTYTENYELPLIEGTDVIDYAPYNESMGKIDEALNTMGDNVQEAKDDVAEMGDTLTQKMGEVDQALQDTVDNVNASLEQTTEDLNAEVDSKLNRISKFILARQYEIPTETYLYGSESGALVFPITSVTPTISRVADVQTPQNNRFYGLYAGQTGTPVVKVDFSCTVEPTTSNESYVGDCNTILELVKYRSGQSSVIASEVITNTSVKTTISLSALITSSGGDTFGFVLRSNYSHQVLGNASFTLEDIGMKN